MKYRRKSIVVEAIQFTEEMIRNRSYPDYVVVEWGAFGSVRFFLQTLEGEMEIKVGDWLITEDDGEHYQCKPDVFKKIYEEEK